MLPIGNDDVSDFCENRAQILDDALSLARAGLLDYNIAFSLTEYLGQETAYIPWAAAIRNLNYIRGMIETTGAFEHYKVTCRISFQTSVSIFHQPQVSASRFLN